MAATEQGLRRLVDYNISVAMEAVGLMEKKAIVALSASMAQDLPAIAKLKIGHAAQAWCAMLFFDLRGSTKRAENLGPAYTYVTMHALVPALAQLATEKGYVVGFRGDGLFACFGIDASGRNPEDLDKAKVVTDTCSCGQRMIEAVKHVVNPALIAVGCAGDLQIGVGVDAHDVIFTRIGLTNAHEVTAYSTAVNRASKLADSGTGYVHVSARVNNLFPRAKHGVVQITSQDADNYKIIYPHRLLETGNKAIETILGE